MPDHPEIYRKQAEQYEALVSREDYEHNLLSTLQGIFGFEGKSVVEFGAGTGRLTCMLAPLVKSIQAFDVSQHMLDLAVGKLKKTNLHNWQVETGDHRQVKAVSGSADAVISGWSVCYIVVDNPNNWKDELVKVFGEMQRVLRPGGMILLVETLGTGFKQPEPPAHLVGYYAYLKEHGFYQQWIRTDYRFEDMTTARSLSEFFFGAEMIPKIEQDERGIILPECTGIWWKTI